MCKVIRGEMELVKIYNNNVGLSISDNKEVIIMGKGICFNKQIGDQIDHCDIDKIYTLTNDLDSERVKQLITQIPEVYFIFSQRLIDYANNRLDESLNQSLLFSLADHIYHLLNYPTSSINLSYDLQTLYPQEYNIAKYWLDEINHKFEQNINSSEVFNLTLHLVNAQQINDHHQSHLVTSCMSEILELLKTFDEINFDEESIAFHRFITHLRYFCSRIITGNNKVDDIDEHLANLLKEGYTQAYEISDVVRKFVEDRYHKEVKDSEMFYLTLHIQKFLKR